MQLLNLFQTLRDAQWRRVSCMIQKQNKNLLIEVSTEEDHIMFQAHCRQVNKTIEVCYSHSDFILLKKYLNT